jgi:hypothetical protein
VSFFIRATEAPVSDRLAHRRPLWKEWPEGWVVMNVDCSFCNAKYTVGEDLVRGRIARFRCRKCGGIIPVDGRVLSSSVSAEQLSLPPVAISTRGHSSGPPALHALRSVPPAAASAPESVKRGRVAAWIGMAASFGLAIVTWKVLSPTAPERQPIGEVAPVLAAGGVEQPAIVEPSPSEPVAETPESVPHRAAEVAAPTHRQSGAVPRERAATPEVEATERTPTEMPSSGFLPDPVAETIVPFDRVAAIAALDTAAGRAQACKPADTLGATRVAVTFAPSGKVTTAVVEGAPFAGTRVGGCIAATMREAKVPPFSGSAVTVHRSL